MNDISQNVKKVMLVFLVCFFGLISYITYFELFVGPKIVNKPENRRLWVKRNEVLRGNMFDRNNLPLTKSTRIDQETQKREYIEGPAFAHALGYMDIRYGLTGLERKYDAELMNDGEDIGTFIFGKKKSPEERVGNNLKTTLDYNLQKQAYDLLGDSRGAVVALNPKTGEVLCMVSKPSFDPNNLKDIMDKINNAEKNSDILKNSPLINRATGGLYPPGSTFKMITAVSALENIKNIRQKTIEDTGKLVFNQKESLSNFNGEVLGTIDFKDAFVHSSNVYFGSLGLELGNNNLKNTAEKFFFNKDTPADGVTIENSMFPTLKNYEKGNMAQSAIGQGAVLASPMQMALVGASIANDGVMMRPYIVQEVISSKGESVRKISPEAIGTAMSKDTATVMKDLMRAVVTSGTGKAVDIKGLNACGKTGTADHDDREGDEPPHSWFVGFAPYENPQIVVSVIVEEGGQGGRAAARIAAAIMKSAMKIK